MKKFSPEWDAGATDAHFYIPRKSPFDSIGNSIIEFDEMNVNKVLYNKRKKQTKIVTKRICNHYQDSQNHLRRAYGNNNKYNEDDFQQYNWGLALTLEMGLRSDQSELLMVLYSRKVEGRLVFSEYETIVRLHTSFKNIKQSYQPSKWRDLKMSWKVYAVRKNLCPPSITKKQLLTILQVNDIAFNIDIERLSKDMTYFDYEADYLHMLLLDDPLLKGEIPPPKKTYIHAKGSDHIDANTMTLSDDFVQRYRDVEASSTDWKKEIEMHQKLKVQETKDEKYRLKRADSEAARREKEDVDNSELATIVRQIKFERQLTKEMNTQKKKADSFSQLIRSSTMEISTPKSRVHFPDINNEMHQTEGLDRTPKSKAVSRTLSLDSSSRSTQKLLARAHSTAAQFPLIGNIDEGDSSGDEFGESLRANKKYDDATFDNEEINILANLDGGYLVEREMRLEIGYSDDHRQHAIQNCEAKPTYDFDDTLYSGGYIAEKVDESLGKTMDGQPSFTVDSNESLPSIRNPPKKTEHMKKGVSFQPEDQVREINVNQESFDADDNRLSLGGYLKDSFDESLAKTMDESELRPSFTELDDNDGQENSSTYNLRQMQPPTFDAEDSIVSVEGFLKDIFDESLAKTVDETDLVYSFTELDTSEKDEESSFPIKESSTSHLSRIINTSKTQQDSIAVRPDSEHEEMELVSFSVPTTRPQTGAHVDETSPRYFEVQESLPPEAFPGLELLAEMPFYYFDYKVPKTNGHLRINIRHDDDGEYHGLFINSFRSYSRAEEQGLLRIGDEIIDVNGFHVEGGKLEDIVAALKDHTNEYVDIRIRRYAINLSSRTRSTINPHDMQESPRPFEIEEKNHANEHFQDLSYLFELPSQYYQFDIPKTNGHLRLHIRSDEDEDYRGLFIHGFKPFCKAESQGLLKIGDEIIEINDVNVEGGTLEDVINAMKNHRGDFVRMVICRRQRLGKYEEFFSPRFRSEVSPRAPLETVQIIHGYDETYNSPICYELIEKEVDVEKTNGNLGCLIIHIDAQGDSGLFIHSIRPMMKAEEVLRPGDEIVAIDGISMVGKYMADVADIVSKAGDRMHMKIARRYISKQ